MCDDRVVNLLIAPRWSGTADDDWYPWLARSLPDHEVIVAPLLPSAEAPEIAPCAGSVQRAAVGVEPEQTLLVGHSVGCQVMLRYLAITEVQVAGLLCVAGWFAIDEPWDSLRPWIDTGLDQATVRAATPRIRVLLSDDDPFTADTDGNARAWRARLGAEVTVVPGAQHFNRSEEPAVLEAVREMLVDDAAPTRCS